MNAPFSHYLLGTALAAHDAALARKCVLSAATEGWDWSQDTPEDAWEDFLASDDSDLATDRDDLCTCNLREVEAFVRQAWAGTASSRAARDDALWTGREILMSCGVKDAAGLGFEAREGRNLGYHAPDGKDSYDLLGCEVEEHVEWIASASEGELRDWARDWIEGSASSDERYR